MIKILVDTSVWIDALNGKRTWQTDLLSVLIDENESVVICPVIVQEILQGIKEDAHFEQVKDTLSGFEILNYDALEAAYEAAKLYRSIRKQGITICKSNDCLIAFFCIIHNAVLHHNDEDFNKIAQYSTLRIWQNV